MDNSKAVADGTFDSQLDELAGTIASTAGAGFEWLLRVEYEVSYSLFTCDQPVPGQCSDTSYQDAFKHVAQRLKGTHGLTNVKLVYHVIYGDLDAPCLYPGDEVVDVIG